MKIHFDKEKFSAWAEKKRSEMPKGWGEETKNLAIVNDAAELYLQKMKKNGELKYGKCVHCESVTETKSRYGTVTISLCLGCREPFFCLFFRHFSVL